MSENSPASVGAEHRGTGAGLVLDGVTVRHGGTVALDGIDLAIEAGEVVAVVGPSGSGKSTLLRAVAGLEPLVAGRVLIGGRDLAGVPTHQRGLGLMFQDHGLFTHLDVAANIGYGLKLAGVDRRGRQARVGELLDLVGLSAFGSRTVDRLSGGEAQRVALARALAPAPGLLMLDEPLGSLDRALREQLVGELRALLTDLGQTALHVTHDQAEAFAIADRVAVIDHGRLVAVGEPADLWSDPGTVFVARFLGHHNIWTVTTGPDGVLRSGGVALGAADRFRAVDERSALGGGPGDAQFVLPTTAIDLVSAERAEPSTDAATGPPAEAVVEAVVEHVVFDRGHHLVTARLVASGGAGTQRDPASDRGEAGGPTAVFESTAALRVGERCRLRLALGQLRSLE